MSTRFRGSAGDPPVDSCCYKINVLKSSEQLCNGRGASSNRPFVQGRP